ncbi:hypothetical protein Ancab_039769 [Ancistrocladus abbreviatus]
MGDLTNQLEASLKSKLDELPPLSSYCCIYKVPENLRTINEAAYRPWVVSIGPFHRKDERLHRMEEQKLRYLLSFMNRCQNQNLGSYIELIKEQEVVIRQFYAEKIELSSYEFTEMVLLDSAFTIEVFLRNYFPQLVEENDQIFHRPGMVVEVSRDMKLIENQLPFFILELLYDSAFKRESESSPSLLDITCKFFSLPPVTMSGIKHFVDFLRTSLIPLPPRPKPENKQKLHFHITATDLHEAGVKFVASKSRSLLDIEFTKGTLKIPPLNLEDITESFFRNLMVFEQCHYYFDSYIIDYITLLHFLINTPEDVEILVQKGIIKNWLANNVEVSNLFNSMFRQIKLADSNFYYSTLCQKLNEYYYTPWRRQRAILKQKYFNHPWAVISFIYATVLLLLTIIQVTCGVTSNIRTTSGSPYGEYLL